MTGHFCRVVTGLLRLADLNHVTVPLSDTVPRGSLLTSRSTNRKINNSKNGEEAHEDNTRIRARNMAVKPQRLRGRLVNSDDYEILMATYFNVSIPFKMTVFTCCV